MRNFSVAQLPKRCERPRKVGLTMVMDKGLALREAESLVEVAGQYTDLVKLGWSTAYLTPQLSAKLKMYRDANILPYFGGTLFEVFYIRDAVEDFKKLLQCYHMTHVEISDGSIELPHEKKCALIEEFSQDYVVLSEVGSKDESKIIPPYKWIEQMNLELKAGAWKIIGEARESGNIGLFRSTGEVRQGLVEEILTQISYEKIIWEAPLKPQQAWFIKLLGANVNLGNIAPAEVIALETLRLGLRSETFKHFLAPKE